MKTKYRFLFIALWALVFSSGCQVNNHSLLTQSGETSGSAQEKWGTTPELRRYAFKGDGNPLTVFHYTKLNEIKRVTGQDLDLARPNEWSAIASQYLRLKMEAAIEANRNLNTFKAPQLWGYGVYGGSNPFDYKGSYGPVLITFEVSTLAPFRDSTGINFFNIGRHVKEKYFGIFYALGTKRRNNALAVVLRFDSASHPEGRPFVDGSVRLYFPGSNSRPLFESEKILARQINTGILGQSYDPGWADLHKLPISENSKPQQAFLERYHPYLNFFDPSYKFSISPDEALNSWGDPNKKALYFAFRSEIEKDPKWLIEGASQLFNTMLNECQKSTSPECVSIRNKTLKSFTYDLRIELANLASRQYKQQEGRLSEHEKRLIKTLLPPNNAFNPNDLLLAWATPERRSAIAEAFKLYTLAAKKWFPSYSDPFNDLLSNKKSYGCR